MGLYTKSYSYMDTMTPYTDNIAANESYSNSYDLMCVLNDNQRNDMMLFEATIYDDISEVQAYREGIILESNSKLHSLFEKIKDLIKTLWSKIKSIFEKFIIALKRVSSDSKKLVKKYAERIAKCTNWNNFKCKGLYIPEDQFKTDIASQVSKGLWGKNNGNVSSLAAIFDADDDFTKINGLDMSVSDITGPNKKDSNDLDCVCLSILDGTIKNKTFDNAKEYHDHVLEQVYGTTDTDDLTSDIITSSNFFMQNGICGTLNAGDKPIKSATDLKKNFDNMINKCINNLDSDMKDITKSIAASGSNTEQDAEESNDNLTKEQQYIGALSILAGNMQNAITLYVNEAMTQTKLACSQARKIWLSAASWATGSHKEEAVAYCNAVGDVALDETYYEFEREDF